MEVATTQLPSPTNCLHAWKPQPHLNSLNGSDAQLLSWIALRAGLFRDWNKWIERKRRVISNKRKADSKRALAFPKTACSPVELTDVHWGVEGGMCNSFNTSLHCNNSNFPTRPMSNSTKSYDTKQRSEETNYPKGRYIMKKNNEYIIAGKLPEMQIVASLTPSYTSISKWKCAYNHKDEIFLILLFFLVAHNIVSITMPFIFEKQIPNVQLSGR